MATVEQGWNIVEIAKCDGGGALAKNAKGAPGDARRPGTRANIGIKAL